MRRLNMFNNSVVHAHFLLCVEQIDNKNVPYSAEPVRDWRQKVGENIALLHKILV